MIHYRLFVTILIPAFLIYITLSVLSPTIAYAKDESITHFEPEKMESLAIEPIKPEEKSGISGWWYVLIGLVVIGGGAAAAAGGGGGGGGAAGGGGGGGTVGVSW